jgi:thiamine biosynthesis protein ThiI
VKTFLIRLTSDITYRRRGSRFHFESLVVRNIKAALKKHGKNAKVFHEPARIYVQGDDIDPSLFKRIFGISSFSNCEVFEFTDLDDLANKIEQIFKNEVKGKTFAVRCQRSGNHNFTSRDVEILVGAKLRPYALKVDLKNPDLEINVEIRDNRAYIFLRKYRDPVDCP